MSKPMSKMTSKLIEIEDVTRRSALRRIAAVVVAAGAAARMNPLDAQHVHEAAAKMKGALAGYKRQALTAHEWETVTRLAELIVPADEHGGSAVDAGAVELIDLLCSGGDELAVIFHGGLAWLDAEMRVRVGKMFSDAGGAAQTAMLDELVEAEQDMRDSAVAPGSGPYARFRDYRTEDRSTLGPGVTFFDWVRKLSVDAYYTSPIGVKDVGYLGNGAVSTYEVPQEAIDYVMRRSPFGAGD